MLYESILLLLQFQFDYITYEVTNIAVSDEKKTLQDSFYLLLLYGKKKNEK
jgi:hypothetical protein